ncbi:MAG: hypothetical protein O2854_01240 [Chloroflexi bacterium]|nr:hypothetical protein [Chloroflexota bacterium]
MTTRNGNANGVHHNGNGSALPPELVLAIEDIKKKLQEHLSKELDAALSETVTKLNAKSSAERSQGSHEVDEPVEEKDNANVIELAVPTIEDEEDNTIEEEKPVQLEECTDDRQREPELVEERDDKTQELLVPADVADDMRQKQANAEHDRAAHMVLAKGTWDFIRQTLRLSPKSEPVASESLDDSDAEAIANIAPELMPVLEAKDVNIYKGKVRISVRTPGAAADAMQFIREVSAMPELRVLRLTSIRNQRLDLLVGLREPIRLEKKLRSFDQVTVVHNVPDQEPNSDEAHIEVFLRAPLAEEIGAAANHEEYTEKRLVHPYAE